VRAPENAGMLTSLRLTPQMSNQMKKATPLGKAPT
jgi:hypothetical protein